MLLNVVAETPDAIAIVDQDRAYTYSELLRQSSNLAVVMQNEGLRNGDRIGIFLDKSWNALVSLMAVVQAGGVFVNINPLLKAPQVLHIIQDCGIRWLVTDAALSWDGFEPFDITFTVGDAVKDGPPSKKKFVLSEVLQQETEETVKSDIVETDLATIIYTSGSTGKPKGIMITHHNLVVGAQIVSVYLENRASDRVLSVLPFNFDVGLNQFTTMLRVGGTLVLQRSLMPGDILKGLRQHRITGLAGVPGVWALIAQNRKSLSKEPLTDLRYISNTGGMIPQPLLEQLFSLLPHTKLYLMYGLTEAFRSTFCPPEEAPKRGSGCIGKAIPNTRICVVDEHGRETLPDEVGELIHVGPTVAMGYWGAPEKTDKAYRINPLAPPEKLGRDIAVYSGDLVRRDKDGYLYIIGRRDEQIKTQGYRVSPYEIEELLQSTGMVYEAAAFGKKDPSLGQRIIAVVSLKPSITEDGAAESIRRACAESAPSHLIPQEIVILKELPKNSNGKIDREKLRDGYATETGK